MNSGEYDALRNSVCDANWQLYGRGLVIQTEGNASGRQGNIMAIKPSGVSYSDMNGAMMVLVDIDSGLPLEGQEYRPSSDTPTHVEIYRFFREKVGGIVHTHSINATVFAQMGRVIPCYGTTHADLFFGDVPVTETLTKGEIEGEYEQNTGRALVHKLNPPMTSAVLVHGHGPFVVGGSALKAVDVAEVLEKVATMAIAMHHLGGIAAPISLDLMKRHWWRKNGLDQYYGQKK